MILKDIKPAPLGDIPGSPETLKLNEFRPKSVFNTPVTSVPRAFHPVIDMHAHAWSTETDISEWISVMDAANISNTTVLSFETGVMFDKIIEQYAPFGDRFSIWCGFDYTGYDSESGNWTEHALAELKRCKSKGAKGVGELGDKGLGEYYSAPVPGIGMHIDDARMDPLFHACGEMNLPVSIHVADPIWMYLPMDATNDGMMNAYHWRIEMKQNLLDHQQLIDTLGNAVHRHQKTKFIACHFANCTHDLSIVGKMLDNYPNLYADITSRLKELCTVPRYAKQFIEKYQDRLLFGSDIGYDPSKSMEYAASLYAATFRLLESADEHIYEHDLFKYHWPLYGLELSDTVLKKLYSSNARRLMEN